jgi:hypothetical protein
MKKYLLIILLLTTFLVRGQTPGTGFVTVTPANGKFNPTTGQFANYFGSAYGWLWYVSQNQLKAKLDSITSANSTLFSGKKDKSDSTTGAGYYTNYKALSKINVSDRGALNGVASLVNGTVPLSQMNAALIGSVKYIGTWNAATNTPNLPSADTTKGWYYIVSTSGTQYGLTYGIGDWVISNGVTWGKVDNNNAVTSVNSKVGAVSLNTDDVSEGTTNKYDKTVALSNGTGITVSGTYPNFTITNSAPSSGGTVTSVSGTSPIVSSGGNTPAISINQSLLSLTKSQISDFGTYSTDIHSNITALNAVSGTNTGDNATNTQYSGLVSNATHTGDVTGSTALTLATVNSNIGTYNNITINAKGLATAGSNVSYESAFSKLTAFNKNFGTSTGQVWGFDAHPSTFADYGLTTAISGYLPLSGGTLTGVLNGTSAVFSGDITSRQINLGSGYGVNIGDFQIGANTGTRFGIYNNTMGIDNFTINPSTGAATFSSSVQTSQINPTNLTANYLPKMGTGGLVNGIGYDNGTQFNIGTTFGFGKFAVAGTNALSWSSSGNNIAYGVVTIGDASTGGSMWVNTPSLDGWASGLGVDGTFDGTYISTINLKAFGVKYSGYGSKISLQTSNGTSLVESMSLTPTGVSIPSTTASTSSTTGSLVVGSGGSGGLGVAGNGYFGGSVTATGATFTTGAGSGKVWTSDGSGVGSWQTNSVPTLSSGTYTPTITNLYGTSSIVARESTYQQIGNIIHVKVTGQFVQTQINPSLSISLPFTRGNAQANYPVGVGIVDVSGITTTAHVMGETTTSIWLYYTGANISSNCDFAVEFDYSL